jgi:tryptophan synthase beta chain
VAVTDDQALEGFKLLSEREGIIPALEPAHAIYHAARLAQEVPKDEIIVVNLSGRGDKDLGIVARAMGVEL